MLQAAAKLGGILQHGLMEFRVFGFRASGAYRVYRAYRVYGFMGLGFWCLGLLGFSFRGFAPRASDYTQVSNPPFISLIPEAYRGNPKARLKQEAESRHPKPSVISGVNGP